MAYILMALDECGTETRLREPWNAEFDTSSEAREQLIEALEAYPEYRSIWVEELQDKAYWARIIENEEYNEYGGY